MARRMLAVSLLLMALIVGVPAGTASPAAAATGSAVFVSGNFTGDAREELFVYRAGAPQDEYLVSFSNGGVTGGDLFTVAFPYNVGGNSYRPVAGDFDGDGLDEIFWHGPGTTPDSMWNFTGATTHTTRAFTVGGAFQPLVGDYTGDGVDDIFWYAAGPAADFLWDFNAGGSFTSTSQPVSLGYRPAVASIGKDATDDIVWYAPGTAADSMWDFTLGTTTHTTQALTVNGTAYQPFGYDYFAEGAQSQDVYWYTPSAAADPFWDFFQGQRFEFSDLAEPFDDSSDKVTVGDYFGDGFVDILFVTNSDFSDFTLFDSAPTQDFIYDVSALTASRTAADASSTSSSGVAGVAQPKTAR